MFTATHSWHSTAIDTGTFTLIAAKQPADSIEMKYPARNCGKFIQDVVHQTLSELALFYRR